MTCTLFLNLPLNWCTLHAFFRLLSSCSPHWNSTMLSIPAYLAPTVPCFPPSSCFLICYVYNLRLREGPSPWVLCKLSQESRAAAPDSVDLLAGACQCQPGGPDCRIARTSSDCSFIFWLFRVSSSCTSFSSPCQTDNEVAISTVRRCAPVTRSSVAN